MTEADSLVDRYLHELEAGLRGLPDGHRREILDEVRGHILEARTAEGADTEAGVRTVLDRLGDPTDIAAEARERLGVAPEPARPATTPWLEVIALLLLAVPFVGWLPGIVLLWVSRLWTTSDKLIGTLLSPTGVVFGLAGTVIASAPFGGGLGSAGPGPIEVAVFVLPFVLPIVAVIYLAIRLRALTSAAATAR
jgi:uncharacterized membrane protein